MRAIFLAGTVSGAPKIRAMLIIADLKGTTRGPHGGCVGYFSFNGNLDTWITIPRRRAAADCERKLLTAAV